MTGLTKYFGGCHCGTVRFEVLAPRKLLVVECNCSVCSKKQCRYFLVSASDFKLLSGHTDITTYTFGTHNAKHVFCSKCGVQSFFIPRSHPEGMAIMPHCVDNPLPLKYKVEKFDGRNWELAMRKSKIFADKAGK